METPYSNPRIPNTRNLQSDTITVPFIKATNSDGLKLFNDAGEKGILVKDNGKIAINSLDTDVDLYVRHAPSNSAGNVVLKLNTHGEGAGSGGGPYLMGYHLTGNIFQNRAKLTTWRTGVGSQVPLYLGCSTGFVGFEVKTNNTTKAYNFTWTSDDRLKENERYITNATETLKKLTPQIYDKFLYLDLSGNPKEESGLVAQELWYNAPELRHLITLGRDYDSSGNEYTPTPDDLDLSGNDIHSDIDYGNHGWSKTEAACLDYIGLIPYLIKSNQELEARISELEN
jgi:hypothetical protein